MANRFQKAGRNSWDSLTPAQQKAKIAAMTAGRLRKGRTATARKAAKTRKANKAGMEKYPCGCMALAGLYRGGPFPLPDGTKICRCGRRWRMSYEELYMDGAVAKRGRGRPCKNPL